MLSRTAWSSSMTRMRGTVVSVRQRRADTDTRKLPPSGGRAPSFGGRVPAFRGEFKGDELKTRSQKLMVALALLLSACAPGPVRVGLPGGVARSKPIVLRVQVKEGTSVVVRDVPVEDYVIAAALSEVHPDVQDERVAERIFEVQTVIARTYAITNRARHAADGFDLCSTTHCQLYEPARTTTSRWASTARAAAIHTSGEVLWYEGAPARAVFHA